MSTEAMRKKEESHCMKVGERRMNFLTQTDCVLQGYSLTTSFSFSLALPHNVIKLVQIENVELALLFSTNSLTLSPWQRKSNYASCSNYVCYCIQLSVLALYELEYCESNKCARQMQFHVQTIFRYFILFYFIFFHCYNFSLGDSRLSTWL